MARKKTVPEFDLFHLNDVSEPYLTGMLERLVFDAQISDGQLGPHIDFRGDIHRRIAEVVCMLPPRKGDRVVQMFRGPGKVNSLRETWEDCHLGVGDLPIEMRSALDEWQYRFLRCLQGLPRLHEQPGIWIEGDGRGGIAWCNGRYLTPRIYDGRSAKPWHRGCPYGKITTEVQEVIGSAVKVRVRSGDDRNLPLFRAEFNPFVCLRQYARIDRLIAGVQTACRESIVALTRELMKGDHFVSSRVAWRRTWPSEATAEVLNREKRVDNEAFFPDRDYAVRQYIDVLFRKGNVVFENSRGKGRRIVKLRTQALAKRRAKPKRELIGRTRAV